MYAHSICTFKLINIIQFLFRYVTHHCCQLQVIAMYKQFDLVTHTAVYRLIRIKWKHFGMYVVVASHTDILSWLSHVMFNPYLLSLNIPLLALNAPLLSLNIPLLALNAPLLSLNTHLLILNIPLLTLNASLLTLNAPFITLNGPLHNILF